MNSPVRLFVSRIVSGAGWDGSGEGSVWAEASEAAVFSGSESGAGELQPVSRPSRIRTMDVVFMAVLKGCLDGGEVTEEILYLERSGGAWVQGNPGKSSSAGPPHCRDAPWGLSGAARFPPKTK